jgi:hypothetical protein
MGVDYGTGRDCTAIAVVVFEQDGETYSYCLPHAIRELDDCEYRLKSAAQRYAREETLHKLFRQEIDATKQK